MDFSVDPGTGTGLDMIAGIKTLDTNILGAITIAGITVWIHNRFFEKRLPEYQGIFQGSPLVGMIGFIVMLLLALLTCWIWPPIQEGIASLQSTMVTTGLGGIWIYNFLNRVLIPTRLHHFIWMPFYTDQPLSRKVWLNIGYSISMNSPNPANQSKNSFLKVAL